jgi:hypothetical protein
MEDIREYLEQKDAIAACFLMRSGKCKVMIATESQKHLHHIIDNWGEVEKEESDIKYLFHNTGFLSRQEQVSLIQSKIEAENATPLIKSEEQKIAEICSKYGADRVWYKNYGDHFKFLIHGNIDDNVTEELRELSKEHHHEYMNPPRCHWKYEGGEVEVVGAVSPLKSERIIESGERLY